MSENSGDPRPYYNHHVFCCIQERPEDHPLGSCVRVGSRDVIEYLSSRVKELELEGVRVNSAGCLGRCSHGPAMVVYPEGVWYRCANRQDAEQILQDHILGGKPVDRLIVGADD